MRLLTLCGSLQAASANRSALDIAHRVARARTNVTIDDFERLADLPALQADGDRAPVVDEWRRRAGAADTMLIAAPEYAGDLAGATKNALDWLVGSGELYGTPVAVISAGTTGGHHARATLVRTLTWQGAHVVASAGIAGPRTKSDEAGRFTDAPTIAAIETLTATLLDATGLPQNDLVALVRSVVEAAGVDSARIAPIG